MWYFALTSTQWGNFGRLINCSVCCVVSCRMEAQTVSYWSRTPSWSMLDATPAPHRPPLTMLPSLPTWLLGVSHEWCTYSTHTHTAMHMNVLKGFQMLTWTHYCLSAFWFWLFYARDFCVFFIGSTWASWKIVMSSTVVHQSALRSICVKIRPQLVDCLCTVSHIRSNQAKPNIVLMKQISWVLKSCVFLDLVAYLLIFIVVEKCF